MYCLEYIKPFSLPDLRELIQHNIPKVIVRSSQIGNGGHFITTERIVKLVVSEDALVGYQQIL